MAHGQNYHTYVRGSNLRKQKSKLAERYRENLALNFGGAHCTPENAISIGFLHTYFRSRCVNVMTDSCTLVEWIVWRG